MSMLYERNKRVRRYWYHIVLMLLLLMGVKGNAQWEIAGPQSVSLNGSYSYYPTYNGSSELSVLWHIHV